MKKFIFINFVLVPSLFSQDLLDIKLISSENNQIKIQIINKSETIVTFNAISVIEVNEGREDTIRFDINCLCDSKCNKSIIILYQNEKKEYLWDKKNSECKNVTGTFKFVVEKGDLFIGESKKIYLIKK